MTEKEKQELYILLKHLQQAHHETSKGIQDKWFIAWTKLDDWWIKKTQCIL